MTAHQLYAEGWRAVSNPTGTWIIQVAPPLTQQCGQIVDARIHAELTRIQDRASRPKVRGRWETKLAGSIFP